MSKIRDFVGRLKARGITAAVIAAEGLAVGQIRLGSVIEAIRAPVARYDVECYGADGALKWSECRYNTVMTAGKNDLLTNYFKGSSYTAAFYVGLVDNASFSAISAADTASSHAGWLEGVPYSNSTRASLALGTPSAGSVDNSASKASFTINATATVNGAFVITNSTKSGTTGTLYSASSFGSTRSVLSGDTLNVQVTLSV
jgi:hypothetical protein